MKNRDEPAFPVYSSNTQLGMTLRDYFAAKAMRNVLDKIVIIDLLDPVDIDKDEIKEAVSKCYDIAEAMIAEKMKRERE